MKKIYIIPILVICILIAVAEAVSLLKKENVKFNDSYVNGNTAGNLYNGGMFCEHNGTIFFANPDDGNRLYSMDSDGQNLKKLSNDVANYINADDNYVYYVRNNVNEGLNYNFFSFYRNALCRISREGGAVTILDTEPCSYASLIGNYIYYLHYDSEDATTLYKVKIDGTDRKQVLKDSVFTCSTEGQYFYYNGTTTTGSIFQFDTASDSSSVIYGGNCYKPTVSGNGAEIYYIDCDQNYALVYASVNTNNPILVTSDSVDAYNIYDDYIYYQKYDGDNSGLCMMKKNGTESVMIMEGTFKNISATSSFVFFTDFYSGETYYFFRTSPDNVMDFNPGVQKD